MSTTTNAQDQESVTVPLNLNLLQSLLSLQFVQLSQQGTTQGKPANNTNRPAGKDQAQAQNQRPKSQLALDKPQVTPNVNQAFKKDASPFQKNMNPGANKPTTEIALAQDTKKEQGKQGSSSGVNMQNPLALLSQLAQLNQMGLGNLLAQVSGNQNSQNKSNGQENMNESSNGSMNRGGPSKFKYSSTLSGGRPQREDSNSQTRPFANRQNSFNGNDGNNNFRDRGNGNGNFNFRDRSNGNGNFQRGNGNGNFQRGGNNQMRGRNFNNFNGENNGGERRFQPRGQNDFSRSREREKSTDFRNGKFGGMNMNSERHGNNQDGRRGPFIPNARKGDWVCPDEECKNVNFATRAQCNRCGIEKPQELIEIEEERRNNAPTFKKGDWNCPNCRNLNFARRSTCNRCDSARPEETYEDYRPGKLENQGEDLGFGNDNCEPGEVGDNQNDWVNTAGNYGDGGLEDGEVA